MNQVVQRSDRSLHQSTPRAQIQFYTTKHLVAETQRWLKALLQTEPNIQTALDAPAGGGALTRFLIEELNLDATAVELDDAKWVYDRASLLLADLGRPLPLETESFDLVVSLEGLKHFTDVATAIGEFNRVLKPGGYLLLTIPNDLCLQSRARYFFDGWVDTDWISPMDPNSQNERDNFHLNSLVSFPYLSYFIAKNKLEIVKTGADRYRFWSVLMSVVFYPMIYLVSLRKLGRSHALHKEMTSMTWLAGRRNLILCKKPVGRSSG